MGIRQEERKESDDDGRKGPSRVQSSPKTRTEKVRKEQARTLSSRIVSLELELGKVSSNLERAKRIKNETQLDIRRMKRAVNTGRYGAADEMMARRAQRRGESSGTRSLVSGGGGTSQTASSSHFRQERELSRHTSSSREKTFEQMMSEVQNIANATPFDGGAGAFDELVLHANA